MDDIEQIRRLIFEYCYATDGGDKEGWVATFTDDVIWDGPFGSFQGKDGARAFSGDNDTTAFRHLTLNPIIDVNGDTATGQSYLLLIAAGQTPAIVFAGVYKDRYVKQNGRWLIAERHILAGPADMAKVTELAGAEA